MGLFENFPYTNFHNLNLDWIIKILKNAVAELEEIQTNWESVRDTANTAKTTADAAAVKAENARTTANGAMTKADSAKTQSENAELTAEDAQATSRESDEKAARAEIVAGAAQSTANAAKTTADGVDAKATTALENSTNAVTTANAAKTTADGVDAKATTALENSTNAVTTANAAKTTATNADSKVDALTKTVDTVGKTANDAISLESAVFVNQEPSIDTAGAGTYTINVSPTVSYNLYNIQVAAPQSLVNWLTEVRDLLTFYDVVYSPTLLANTSSGEYTLPVMGSVIDSQNILHMYALFPFSSDDTDGVVSIENINAHLVYKARRKPTA